VADVHESDQSFATHLQKAARLAQMLLDIVIQTPVEHAAGTYWGRDE
jgi:hypothetical protein